jgi:hypothetical protein
LITLVLIAAVDGEQLNWRVVDALSLAKVILLFCHFLFLPGTCSCPANLLIANNSLIYRFLNFDFNGRIVALI